MRTVSALGKSIVLARCLAAASVIALGAGASVARADVLIDTFRPGDTFDSGLRFGINSSISLAVRFTAPTAVTVDSVLAAIGWNTGTPTLSLGIMNEVAGVPSNSFLYKAVLNQPTPNVALSGLGWSLGAGNYWLAAVADPGFVGGWETVTSSASPVTFASDAADFGMTRQWTPLTLVTGFGPAVRITTAAPVPEPETYAMMLAGLGLIGAIVRRRNRMY